MALIFIDFTNSFEKHQAREAYKSIDHLVFRAHSSLIRITYNREEQQRYEQWFGVYSENNKKAVSVIINAIHSALRRDVTLIKGGAACDPNDYAYIENHHIGVTLHIHLCPMFFSAGLNGRDTTVGTIIHELSHLLGNTQDHRYGDHACECLARVRPAEARNNVDSYLYYCESFQ